MRIYESDGKLEFVKVTKENIDDNAIYILSTVGGTGLWFVIFKGIYIALSLNNSLKVVERREFNPYIQRLLS